MRDRSETWKRLAARGNFRMESVAVINGVEYSKITAPIITNGLLPDKTLSVGNCIAGTLKFTVMTNDTIPKSAEVVIKARITDETTYSEWLEFGHFWIDKRTVNENLDERLIDLECFDAMLKGNQVYVDNSQAMSWPKPMSTVVSRIAEQMGVQTDPRNVIKTGNAYVVYKPDDGTTLLDILRMIGEVHGGNWTITSENTLRLVPLVSAPAETFYVVDENYRRIKTPEGDNLTWLESDDLVMPYGIGYINIRFVLGDITLAKPYTISRVTMSLDEEHVFTSGDDTGYELKIDENPYASQEMCDTLFSELNGLEYAPFTMTKAVYDPAVDLGDMLFAGERLHSVLYAATQRFDIIYRVDASAPGEDELESEYPFVTALQKTKYSIQVLKHDNTRIWSSISQTQESISLEVIRATGAESNLSGRIDVNAGNIALKVSKDSVIAEINASTETSGGSAVLIRADKVNLTGYATFTALRTAGQTTINGANITTGHMSADRIQGGTLVLGGLNNQSGILEVHDANNVTIGIWTNQGIVTQDEHSKVNIAYGSIDFYYNNALAGSIKSDTYSGIASIYMLSDYVQIGKNITGNPFVKVYKVDSNSYVNITTNTDKGDYTPRIWLVDSNNYTRISYFAPNNGYIYGHWFEEGNVFVNRNFQVGGTKSRVVETDQYSNRLLYCYETPSPMFGDVGEGVISDDGLCYVTLDAVFAQTVTTSQYQVFLQKYGDGDCWVKARNGAYLIVQGTPGLAFGWEIKAKQRDFDQLRLEKSESKFAPPMQTYGQDAAEYIKNLEDGRIPA